MRAGAARRPACLQARQQEQQFLLGHASEVGALQRDAVLCRGAGFRAMQAQQGASTTSSNKQTARHGGRQAAQKLAGPDRRRQATSLPLLKKAAMAGRLQLDGRRLTTSARGRCPPPPPPSCASRRTREDAALASDVLGGVDVVASDHAHGDACALAGGHCVGHLLAHGVLRVAQRASGKKGPAVQQRLRSWGTNEET